MTTGTPRHSPGSQGSPVPPPDGYTVHDLLSPPDIPAHVELLDGWLSSDGPHERFHGIMTDLLVQSLRGTVPPHLKVQSRMTVVIDERNAPEPDITIVRAAAVRGGDQLYFPVRDVLLAVEVVSPRSAARDRDTKPRKYADAGVPYFWRVGREGVDDAPVVHAYALDARTRSYRLVGTFHDEVKLDAPFALSIDLTALDRL
ncbi:hypothetical protein A6A06_04940 [Streptomyces sp. CB02923]|uniref:Uma2 family endonuclease n=1 Tax=Streptomyces sp. CB02923 TaxID=1718985 RepID=UPI00093B12FF|nr:Uma2 family endonuclease [Streptomyces sp. CB02923]OKI09968.1 hypothetical protein A6A06_04940 [Streptomyces sp. CB02923]